MTRQLGEAAATGGGVKMDARRALRVAIRELKDARAALAFDRNAYERLGARYPQALRAARRSSELQAALEELRGMLRRDEQPEGEVK